MKTVIVIIVLCLIGIFSVYLFVSGNRNNDASGDEGGVKKRAVAGFVVMTAAFAVAVLLLCLSAKYPHYTNYTVAWVDAHTVSLLDESNGDTMKIDLDKVVTAEESSFERGDTVGVVSDMFGNAIYITHDRLPVADDTE